jgi:2-amino-4-hydroxy-6-hydroxymethyldihydropteridine diphosphokinase
VRRRPNEHRRAFIALGANLPFEGLAPATTLARAAAALEAAGLKPRAYSSLWETAPWPVSNQPAYLNAALELDSGGLAPQPLYEILRTVEAAFGRERRIRWDARTLDLDILAMEGFVGDFGAITLPHPRLHERAFALAPLAEIAPDWRHPALARAPARSWPRCPRQGVAGVLTRLGPKRGAGGLKSVRPSHCEMPRGALGCSANSHPSREEARLGPRNRRRLRR